MPKPEEFPVNTGKKLTVKGTNEFEVVYVVSHTPNVEVQLFVSANTSSAPSGEPLVLTNDESEALINVGREQVSIYLFGWGENGPQLGFMNPSREVNITPYTNK